MSEGVGMVERMTNIELGELLGLSHVQVSRIRAGTRFPSPPAMRRIEKILDWSGTDQLKVHGTPEYASEFEKAAERYASARDATVGPTD